MIALFPSEEIRPQNGLYIPRSAKAVQQRYGFVSTPDFSRPLEELDREGYKFAHGQFEHDGKEILIGEFGFFSDGISVTCLDTALSDLVWNDLLAWAQNTLGMRAFIREPRRYYRSQVVVEFDQKLAGLVANFAAIATIVQNAMTETVAHRQPIDLFSIAFGMDVTKIPGLTPVPFTLERKVGAPFEFERFFSQASLPTRVHIEALRAIEASLSTT
ncbi:MAG: hypothetical protein GEU87_11540 [Alphaproteobacteria bacterium]|nr:hypothetical protein [Alphaproteobacteria bacterium]